MNYFLVHGAEWKKHKYIEKKNANGYVRYIYKPVNSNTGESTYNREQKEHEKRINDMIDLYKAAVVDYKTYLTNLYGSDMSNWPKEVQNTYELNLDIIFEKLYVKDNTYKDGIARVMNAVISSSIANTRTEELNKTNRNSLTKSQKLKEYVRKGAYNVKKFFNNLLS